MKPSLRQRRRISSPLRTDRALSYEQLSDPILIRRAKDGDKKALEALCARHAPRIERIARRELGDPQDAQDAAQDALAKLCQRIDQFRGEAQLSTWLHRLVVNTCRDFASRERIRRHQPLEHELDLECSLEGDPEREALVGEIRGELGVAFAELSPVQARVVWLKDGLGLSFEEISKVAGMPVGTAKCYAHRARERLRKRLEGGVAA